jgi:hypothetical protein
VKLDEDAILGDIMEELNSSGIVRPSTPHPTKLRRLTPVQPTDLAARYKYSISDLHLLHTKLTVLCKTISFEFQSKILQKLDNLIYIFSHVCT